MFGCLVKQVQGGEAARRPATDDTNPAAIGEVLIHHTLLG